MIILDGKKVSEKRRAALIPRIVNFTQKVGRAPHLVVVLVGDMTASVVYVRNKEKACATLGIKSTLINKSKSCTQQELNNCIDQLNADSNVDGVLVQLPLPDHLNPDEVFLRLSAEKDADGLTFQSMGLLWGGKANIAPCTPKGVMSILEHYNISVAGKKAVVVGRSNIVGKPMAHLLMEANATVTICHSKTERIQDYTLAADIVVVAAGKKWLLGKKDFKKDSVIIDVGMHGTGEGKTGLAGDVKFSELDGWVSAATPVPGGVGPMTITTLLENTVTLAEKNNL